MPLQLKKLQNLTRFDNTNKKWCVDGCKTGSGTTICIPKKSFFIQKDQFLLSHERLIMVNTYRYIMLHNVT